ncbi:adenosylcobyric acid synthase [Rhodobium orientis]|nr:cobyric acid synthase [Rhodobium orientis]MBB4304706.1 adenosylcobyric acid synthase [Rhodobium orientis]
MFQGTGSNVGKSLLTAGIARALTRRGLTVRPFKPQNMSNNAMVTADGGEIGRAQALQARACGVPPTVDMNPVLLKPQSEVGAQIVVQGKVTGSAKAREFQEIKRGLMPAVLESFERLKAAADIVVVEGAGSAAETNLRANDIANMGFARAADVPVVLVGDIDRGGVIASLVGTKTVLERQDVAMIEGFIVNKMRGDPSLFADGMTTIAEKTSWAAIGLLPYFDAARLLPAEDAFELAERTPVRKDGAKLKIAVPLLPRIANFDDFDPLAAEPDVDLVFVAPGEPLPAPLDLVILPGSKATIADLADFRANGWDIDLAGHHRRGGRVLGVCGGYQMLGKTISDPDGIEGPPASVPGLGLLDIETVLTGDKRLTETSGTSAANGAPFAGYEMHIGETVGPDTERPVLTFADGRQDGATADDGLVSGTYLHGLFGHDAQRAAFIETLGGKPSGRNHDAAIEATLDALADHIEAHLDLEKILKIAR